MRATMIMEVFWACLILCYTQIYDQETNGQLSDDRFSSNEQLADGFQLFWNINQTHIMFKLQVRTNGLILFGIASNKNNEFFDIVLGGLNRGKSYFTDMHVKHRNQFLIDSSQDWYLINVSESMNLTSITMLRELNASDPDDLPITNEPVRVVFSHQPYDPDNGFPMEYPELQEKDMAFYKLTINDKSFVEDVENFDLLIDNFTVPERHKYFQCKVFTEPILYQKHHFIRYEPLIQDGHEHIVHHILLFTCRMPLNKQLVQYSFYCTGEFPIDLTDCDATFVFWSINGPAYDFPTHVGFPVGGHNRPTVFVMEIHYESDNQTIYVDNSGLRIYITKNLRQHDAGHLGISIDTEKSLIIPPGEDSFLSSGYCHEECIKKKLGDQEIRSFFGLVHAHSHGRKIRLLHFRNGTQLPLIIVADNYRFNQQILYTFTEEVVIKKGDTLMIQCEYNSTGEVLPLIGDAEMCLAQLFYYPNVNIFDCFSSLNYKNKSLSATVKSFNWSDPQVKKQFSKEVEEAEMTFTCILNEMETKFVGPVPKYT